MIDSWNPAVLNETTQAIDSWNPAELNQATTKVDSWNAAILNKNLESSEPPVVFSATITASFPEGATCTATDGTTTLTADDNPMAFSIPNEGTWAVACVANGVTFSENVVITTNGQTETVDLTPVGETITPTDSVPMLIACAGIGDSEITTIAGALADADTLTAILESENAVDYLVRSTAFASAVTSDSGAMTLIGANNYASNTLLGNSTWLNAICNSTYFESVLNVKVPAMTSNTTPSGECFASTENTSYPAWRAFDGTVNAWQATSTTDQYIGYRFTKTIKVCKFTISPRIGGAGPSRQARNYIIQGSNDNSTFEDLYSDEIPSGSSTYEKTGILSTIGNYEYYRAFITNTWGNMQAGITTLQFYGREDV